MAHILTTSEELIGTITLDHQPKRNALSHALVEEVLAALRDFRETKVRVVILRAQPGCTVWSAGHDVDELPVSRRDPLGWDDPLRQLVREIETYPGPVIAMIDGGVWGGACEIVLACDLIVASLAASFGLPEVKRCLLAGGGGLHRLPRAIPRHIALELALTGEPVDASRAHTLGLLSRLVPQGAAVDAAVELAELINGNAPLAVRATRRLMLASHLATDAEAIDLVNDAYPELAKADDFDEGPRAFLEKRPPVWKGR